MTTQNTEAIIIKATKLNEADKILTFFTRFHGKQQAIAKGIRRITSRRSGNLEIFNHTKLHLYEGKKLAIVTEAEVIEPFTKMRTDLDTIAVAYQILELLDQFSQEDQENRELFDLVLGAFQKLERGDDARKVTIVCKIKLLNIVGFRPVVDRCVRCGDTEKMRFFSNALGGLLNENCSEFDPAAISVSAALIRSFQFFQTESEEQIKRARMSDTLKSEVNSILDNYLEYILEGALKSKKFTQAINEI